MPSDPGKSRLRSFLPVESGLAILWSGLLLMAGLEREVEAAPPDPEGSGRVVWLAPEESKVVIAWASDGSADPSAAAADARSVWGELLVETIDEVIHPIRSGWDLVAPVRSSLVPNPEALIHAVADDGRTWLQGVRWQDPVVIQRGLMSLGARLMGGGRFRLPEQRLDVLLAEPWLLIGPQNGRWLDSTADRLRDPEWESVRPFETPRSNGPQPGAIEVVLRHAAPTGGATLLSIHPQNRFSADIDFLGEYDASPLPIRTAVRLDTSPIARLDGRMACVMQEGGVGLLDPMIIRHASSVPELVPEAWIRRRFAPRRLVAIDGESVILGELGAIEVPSVCIAVPMRGGEAVDPRKLEDAVDAWLASAGTAVRSNWDEGASSGVERSRDGRLRHFSLGPGFLEAVDGHPAALAASLDWTVCGGIDDDRGWLVVGSSPRIVRRVSEALEPVGDDDGSPRLTVDSRAMWGVASPSRIGLQLSELGLLRGRGSDAVAAGDATLLQRASVWLEQFDHVEWSTERQDDRAVQGRVRIRLTRVSAAQEWNPESLPETDASAPGGRTAGGRTSSP